MPDVISAADLDAAAARAVEVLRSGRLVVLPTDTVYAVVADAFSTEGTQRLLGAKRRGREFPLSLFIRNPRQVIGLAAETPETAERLMASYWPGPVAIVLPEQPEMPWDLGRTDGAVTLRMPADDLVLAIAAEVGPLACSAANRRGEAPPATVEEAQLQIGEAADLYIDGGRMAAALPTIVDCTAHGADVLREGSVPTGDIHQVASGDVGWGRQPGPDDIDIDAAMAVDPPSPHHSDQEH